MRQQEIDAIALHYANLNGTPDDVLFGLPGNLNVALEAYRRSRIVIDADMRRKFVEQHPRYKSEDGWLWVIYKDINGSDLGKTLLYLATLVTTRK